MMTNFQSESDHDSSTDVVCAAGVVPTRQTSFSSTYKPTSSKNSMFSSKNYMELNTTQFQYCTKYMLLEV